MKKKIICVSYFENFFENYTVDNKETQYFYLNIFKRKL